MRSKTFLLALLLLGVFFVSLPVVPSNAGGDSLTLHVIPNAGTQATSFQFSGKLAYPNGTGIGSQGIELYWSGSSFSNVELANTFTDSSGDYTAYKTGIAPGAYSIEARFYNSSTTYVVSPTVTFTVSGPSSTYTLTLSVSSNCVRINDTFTLTAHLINTTTGADVAGAKVVFQMKLNSSSYSTIGSQTGYATGSDGKASIAFTSRYNGTYQFRAVYGQASSNVMAVATGCVSPSPPADCGFLGLGCLAASVNAELGAAGAAIAGFFGGIARSIGSALGPVAAVFNWIWGAINAFLNFMFVLFNVAVAIFPYASLIFIVANVYYIVRADIDGLFRFYGTIYQAVSVVASVVIGFVQVVVDIINTIRGGAASGAEVVAAGA